MARHKEHGRATPVNLPVKDILHVLNLIEGFVWFTVEDTKTVFQSWLDPELQQKRSGHQVFTLLVIYEITSTKQTRRVDNMFKLLIAQLILLVSVSAFVAPGLNSKSFVGLKAGLEEIDAVDPFDSYSQTDPSQKLMYRDTVAGTGDVAMEGKVLKVAYTGRLMATGKEFDKGNGFSFRLGEGRVIPGWEQGLVGMRVGGKRTIRIPPGLAYADRGAKDVIPPGSHLEFDCELISIASGGVEEALSQVNMQPERIITFVLLLILLAASPTLHF